MICGRSPSYDAGTLEDVVQQKCLSHLIRNAKTVEESKTGRARQFSRRLKELLQQALALSAKKNKLDAADYTQQVEEPRDELTLHLRDRVLREQPGGAGSAPCGHRTQGLALFPKRTRCTGF